MMNMEKLFGQSVILKVKTFQAKMKYAHILKNLMEDIMSMNYGINFMEICDKSENQEISKQEAYDTMMNYISSVGSCGVEYWTDKDSEIMRKCLDIIMFGEDNAKKSCGNCDWYAEFEGVCTNGDSEFRSDFRCLDDSCYCWSDKDAYTV